MPRTFALVTVQGFIRNPPRVLNNFASYSVRTGYQYEWYNTIDWDFSLPAAHPLVGQLKEGSLVKVSGSVYSKGDRRYNHKVKVQEISLVALEEESEFSEGKGGIEA